MWQELCQFGPFGCQAMIRESHNLLGSWLVHTEKDTDMARSVSPTHVSGSSVDVLEDGLRAKRQEAEKPCGCCNHTRGKLQDMVFLLKAH